MTLWKAAAGAREVYFEDHGKKCLPSDISPAVVSMANRILSSVLEQVNYTGLSPCPLCHAEFDGKMPRIFGHKKWCPVYSVAADAIRVVNKFMEKPK